MGLEAGGPCPDMGVNYYLSSFDPHEHWLILQ
jgi:hypothetical protein